jgi:7-cyano-7-deazaguanine synthase
MLANAVAYAEANNHDVIALGNNLEESGAYPDNEEEFTHLLDGVLDYAVQEGRQVRLVAPVGHLMKHEIVRLGVDINAPLDLTWSCYKDGDKHCGECGPCFMRRTAFERNGLTDPVFG